MTWLAFFINSKKPNFKNKLKDRVKIDSVSDVAPFSIINIGNSQPVNLHEFIRELENALGKKSKKNFFIHRW